MRGSLLFFLFSLSTLAFAGPMPSGSFEVQSVDDAGGGWVIHHVPGLGDRLWGCADLLSVTECKQVYLGDWSPASKIRFLHISEDTQKAWTVVSVPVLGDFLLACSDPETNPTCDTVELELRPPTAAYTRIWPNPPCVEGCAAAVSSGGGGKGPMAGLAGGGPPAPVIEPAAKGNIWLSAAIKAPGPVNLYSCRNLETAPECQLAIPDLLMVDRENIGFKKYDEVESKVTVDGKRLVGIELTDIDEGSAAERSKFREGDVIVRIDGFPIKNKAHFKAILMQYPATFEVPIELESEERIMLRVRRKPPKEKK